MTLYYCPLEPMPERYTMQLSAAKTGWLERNWIEADIDYVRIDPIENHFPKPPHIGIGVALDAPYRSKYCFAQITMLLNAVTKGKMTSSDIIYFDDFWHPGIEALAYTFHLMGIKPKMFANLWAQSVDIFDFTYPMRGWMRHYEKGNGAILDGIFVACPTLKDLVVYGGIADGSKVHAVGHPFSSEEVKERMPPAIPDQRYNQVIFSSRWDKEKDPLLFLEIAERTRAENPDVEFIVCTSAPKIRSNEPELLEVLHAAVDRGTVKLEEGLTKEQYYIRLCRAKVQLNTAYQDWISYTLLETSVAGCYPLYPAFRSFPETLRYDTRFMYERHNAREATSKILSLMERDDLWTQEEIQKRAWIHERFDSTWGRMLMHMGYMTPDMMHEFFGGGKLGDPFQFSPAS